MPFEGGEIYVGETTPRSYPEGKVYILGGCLTGMFISSEIETFVCDSLEQKSNMKIARESHRAAVLKGNVYIKPFLFWSIRSTVVSCILSPKENQS